ncbi:relaxase/mobilization nuclease domain-containing protein [Pseudodesulfovibrio alkaliphilus]|nr:relaxase/mobilization nuclease domain-containing protein [Pseudodesulfovibrio alkaliphilus]
MLDYIARADKEDQELVALEAEDGITRKGQAEVDEVFNEWKPDFNRKSSQSQKSPRHAVHLVLSAKAEITSSNLKHTLIAARATAEKHFGEQGFKYALGVHQDGKYPHVHVVVKTTNTDKQAKKLRLGPAQLLEVRQTLAQELTNRGLAHVATREPAKRKVRHSNMKGPKPDTLNRVKIVLERMEKEQRQFERALSRSNPKVHVTKFQRQQGMRPNSPTFSGKPSSGNHQESR